MALTESELIASYSLASTVLPYGILEYFTLIKAEDQESELTKSEQKSRIITDPVWSDLDIHISLDEKDNRTEEQKMKWKSNGYTEPTIVQDFPIRDRKVFLHVRRRRWLDENDHSIIVPLDYQITVKGIKLSPQFAAFFKGADG